ncbi:HD domain-containing protein [Streptomyces sp. NBC_01361]|uniref:HD domain-containing protein n=1 Tax=Streptomyces sp. NBC_01361 TaxID=2903838 RepID=UPI002E319DB1|nr:caspase family protein [Streptomyces sp. NBC_01361]
MGPEDDQGRRSGKRRALLIGVRETPYLAKYPELRARYPSLDFVGTDMSLVQEALQDSQYEDVVICEDTNYGPVTGALEEFFASCQAGDTVFVYVSCHGETLGDRHYLVLSDSQSRAMEDGSRSLSPTALLSADAAGLLRDAKPGVTTIVCLDTCRTPGPLPTGAAEPQAQGPALDAYWIHSCGRGQRSYADRNHGSWFAQALAKALQPGTPPTTFSEVVEYTGSRLRRLADGQQVEWPTVEPNWPVRAPGKQLDPWVCKGSTETLDWSRILMESALWDHTSGSAATHRRVKEALSELVRCVVESGAGSGAHHGDPWADAAYPARVQARLDDLVTHAKLAGPDQLSPAETACLLAAAVVHEGVVATALQELHRFLPGTLDPGPRGRVKSPRDHHQQVRDAARDVCRAHILVQRTVNTLRGRGLDEAAQAADHWLRHRLIAEWDRLWGRTGDYEVVDLLIGMTVDAVVAAADGPSPKPVTPEDRHEIDSQVRQVLGHFTIKPGSSPRINEKGQDVFSPHSPVSGSRWRGEQMATLLWTAAHLAADPRRPASVLVDHLGAHQPLLPAQVVSALANRFGYDRVEGRTESTRGLAVRFLCPHPALHAAIEETVRIADAAVRAFHAAAGPGGLPPLLRGLPDRVTDEHLRPPANGYKTPVERFRLAEDEIRALLMGTQLYGDRMLAVRELYQNALDACRYRDMRKQYGNRRGRRGPRWNALIKFEQGWDGRRPYIECLDNGAGMTRARLTSMFARAGKRYEQDPEFVLERRNWRREGIEDVAMNSRFGIGVFSYFMLADEVVVWTSAVDKHGLSGGGRAQRADIQSGSGLLQIRDTDSDLVPDDGGTRVRLYLAEPGPNEKRPSLVETLRTQLWVSEHDVVAEELAANGDVERDLSWTPHHLAPRDGWHGEPARAGTDADVWLVQGQGQLLLDGVLVQDAPKVYGRVVNLRERHSPVPSVDRNQILEYDTESVLSELLEDAATVAGQFEEVSLRWLWGLVWDAPRLAVKVIDALPETTVVVLSADEDGRRLVEERLPLSQTGCLPSDDGVLNHFLPPADLEAGGPYEDALLQSWQYTRLALPQPDGGFAPPGYPRPVGLDAVLFAERIPQGWQTVLRTAALADVSIGEALKELRKYAVIGIHVPAAPDLQALRDQGSDLALADLLTAHLSAADSRVTARGRRRPPAEHAAALVVSAQHDISLGEVAERLVRLRELHPELPAPPELDAALAATHVTPQEAGRLAVNRDDPLADAAQLSWQPGRVGPVDLLYRSDAPFSVEEIARRLDRFGPLGFSCECEPAPAAKEQRSLSTGQRLLLSVFSDHAPPWLEGSITLTEVLVIAQRLSTTPGNVAKGIADAASITGVRGPDIPAEAAGWRVPSWVSRNIERWEGKPLQQFRPWELIGAFQQDGDGEPDEFERAVTSLDACGLIRWERGKDATALNRQASVHSKFLRPYPSVGTPQNGQYVRVNGDFDEDGVSLVYLWAMTAVEDRTLGEVADIVRSIDTAISLDVVPVPDAARALQATIMDVLALGEMGPSHAAFRLREKLTVLDLLLHAQLSHISLGTSARRLASFTVIGAPGLPGTFEGPDAAVLDEMRPDRFDLAAFDQGLLGADNVLGPLELVRVAGRFGWTLGKTYDRYAPFRCLGLNVTVPAPGPQEAAFAPDWRDVLILSEQLTGRAPALAWPVTAEHVSLCAQETDLSEDEVRARLSLYSRLFELSLSGAARPE